jgi:predicted Zn-dependent protease
MEAATAYEHERYKDARRVLDVLRERYPQSSAVRELYGLTLYRLGRFREAEKELESVVGPTGSTEQHPVLMDCRRAQGRFDDVRALWDELREASPSGELVTEGRIVMAGALADDGRLGEAIQLLERGPLRPKRVQPHHLRLWYALADLEERAGNIPRARNLFEDIRRREAQFVDVAERLAALG